jgi:hypothetical protein
LIVSVPAFDCVHEIGKVLPIINGAPAEGELMVSVGGVQ